MITSKQAKKEHKKLKSRWSDESKLSQQILIACLEKLEIIANKRTRRPPSAYNLFIRDKMKEGNTMAEASKLWKGAQE